MNLFLKRQLLFALALIVSCGAAMLPSKNLLAQEASKPAVVISMAGFGEQQKALDYMLTASGYGQMKFMAKAMVSGYTKGIDPELGGGVLLYFKGDNPEPDFLGYLPVSDLDEMLDVISLSFEIEEEEDLIRIIPDNGPEVILKEKDGYVFLSNKQEMLTKLPANPAAMGQVANDGGYNLVAEVFPERVPQSLYVRK